MLIDHQLNRCLLLLSDSVRSITRKRAADKPRETSALCHLDEKRVPRDDKRRLIRVLSARCEYPRVREIGTRVIVSVDRICGKIKKWRFLD
jgi:hypothetical protein